MKLPFIASLICLMATGCATAPPAPLPARTVTHKPLPLPVIKGEMDESSVVIIEVIELPESYEAMSPEDYERLSNLIHRETGNIKCVCASGDPFCHCKLPNGPKKLPQE